MLTDWPYLSECTTAQAGRHHQHRHCLVVIAICRHTHLHVLDRGGRAIAVLLIDDVKLVADLAFVSTVLHLHVVLEFVRYFGLFDLRCDTLSVVHHDFFLHAVLGFELLAAFLLLHVAAVFLFRDSAFHFSEDQTPLRRADVEALSQLEIHILAA